MLFNVFLFCSIIKLSDHEDKHEIPYHHLGGPKALHCFAASTVKKTVAIKNYLFYWQRDDKNVSSITVNRTEYEEYMWEPPGMVLKLGKIRVNLFRIIYSLRFLAFVIQRDQMLE